MSSPRLVVFASLVAVGCGWTPPEDELDGGTDAGLSSGDAGTIDAGTPDAGVELSDAGIVAFNGTYLAENFGSCTRMMGLTGFAPADGAKHPLLIYTVGTLDNYGYAATFPYDPSKPNDVMLDILREAARKGFVAVSVEYDNFFLVDCGGLRAKTRCIFDPKEPAGVVGTLCARPDVDCDLGILTGGHSQGSQLAIYAKNWNSRVRATWGLGATVDAVISFGNGAQPGLANPADAGDDHCLRFDSTALADERVRLVNGLDEVCYSTSKGYDADAGNPAANCGPASSQSDLERMSGRTCAPEAMTCLAPNGSGWLVIPNDAVEGGSAHHTYFAVPTDGGTSRLEASFAPPSMNPWSLETNLAWLRTFVGDGDVLPLRIDTGAMVAVDGTFSKDDFFSGGTASSSSPAIDVSAPNAAPASVYQSYRFDFVGAFSYELRGLPRDAALTLRLHFAELFWTTAGARAFNVDVQGVRRETNLDVFAEAGGQNRALVREYSVMSDAAGRVRILFGLGAANTPMVSGIEVF